MPRGSATKSEYHTSQNRAWSYRARAAVNDAIPRAQRSSWSEPITVPSNVDDHPAVACAARLHADAIAVRGERWVTITSASG